MSRTVPSTGWIDSHAHLDHLNDSELSKALDDAAASDVRLILEASTDLATASAIDRHCRERPSIYGAVGISPPEVRTAPSDWEERLAALLENPRIVAIGEIGLDRKNQSYPSHEEQRPVFERQLRIALERDLPVILHSRGAEEECAELCRAVGIRKALFHCFTGSVRALRKVLDCGYDLSFSGIVTFDAGLLELAAGVPSDRLFIETDSPYLSPVPFRGKPNAPARVALIGRVLAEVRGVAEGELQGSLAVNFRRLFGIG